MDRCDTGRILVDGYVLLIIINDQFIRWRISDRFPWSHSVSVKPDVDIIPFKQSFDLSIFLTTTGLLSKVKAKKAKYYFCVLFSR